MRWKIFYHSRDNELYVIRLFSSPRLCLLIPLWHEGYERRASKAAGDRLRNILSAMTRNRFTGTLTGFAITALIQSSSASTVMVVSFVNAGLMTLAQSMAVIFGANVGTTFTAWIIALFGFKVDTSVFILPIIACAVPLLFFKKAVQSQSVSS